MRRFGLLAFAFAACGITERTVEERSVDAAAGETAVTIGGSHSTSGGGPSQAGTATFVHGGVGPMPPRGGNSFGGSPTPFGGATIDFCADPASVPTTCLAAEPVPGAAGASSCPPDAAIGGAADSVNAGGEGGALAAAPAALPYLLIDGLEDGDIEPFPVLGAHGGWFTANDGSGHQFPAPCAVSSVTESGQRAMHTYGGGFLSMAGGFSLLGLTLRTGELGCEKGTDASLFTGVEFKARGNGWLRFFIGTVAINPLTDAGTCVDDCYDAHGLSVPLTPNWGIYRIPFRYLSQEGWGRPVAFDPAQILALMWSAKLTQGSPVPAGCFDFWIDDVSFYTE